MATTTKDHVSNFPIPSLASAATHTTSIQAPNLGGRTFASPQSAARTISVGNSSVKLNPSSQTPGDMLQTLRNAGIDVALDRHGRLVFASNAVIGGDADLLLALGIF